MYGSHSGEREVGCESGVDEVRSEDETGRVEKAEAWASSHMHISSSTSTLRTRHTYNYMCPPTISLLQLNELALYLMS